MAHYHSAAVTAATERAPLLVARNLLPSDSNSSVRASASMTSDLVSSPSSSVDAQRARRRDRKCTGDATLTSTSSSTSSSTLSIAPSLHVSSSTRRASRHTPHSQPVYDLQNNRRRDVSSPHHQPHQGRHCRAQTKDAYASDANDMGLDTFASKEQLKTTMESPLASPEQDPCTSSGGQANDKEDLTVTKQQRQEAVTVKPSRMVVKRRATAPASSHTTRQTSTGPLNNPLSPTRHPVQSADKATAIKSPPHRSKSALVRGFICSHQRSISTLEKWQLRVQRSISGASSGTDDESVGNVPGSSRRMYRNHCSHQLLESPPPSDQVVTASRRRKSDASPDKQARTRARSTSRDLKVSPSPRTTGAQPFPSPLLSSDKHAGPTTPRALARKIPQCNEETPKGENATRKLRPVRILYDTPARGMGEKREISQASLGKLIAHLTDAHQFDTQFRDIFLLTYRSFCSPYDFIKKLLKRYTAVLSLCENVDADRVEEMQRLLDQMTLEEENEPRSSNVTTISTAKSDINTGMEANVSIMRLLSVLKFWIKESTFIEQDLANDRKAQKKLIAFLKEIQNTSPIPSVCRHAENLQSAVVQVLTTLKQQAQQAQHVQTHTQAQAKAQPQRGVASSPPPPALVAASSVSTLPDRPGSKPGGDVVQDPPRATTRAIAHQRNHGEVPARVRSQAATKLSLPRSSSDPKRERSMVKLRTKNPHGDIVQLRSRSILTGAEDQAMAAAVSRDRVVRNSTIPVAAAVVPKIARGITTGSADAVISGNSAKGLDEIIQSTLQRAASRKSARVSYDNVEPLTGLTAHELADQLTLIEAEQYFSKLNPRELTNKAWTRENKHREAPHVMALIELFDATAEWVSSEILHPQMQAVERAKMITLFIDAADHCYRINNFNSLFEILTGLSAPCIRQLNTTWSLVSAVTSEKYQCLQQVCSPDENYRSYRQAFGLAEGHPRLACWFILVKDLFTYEEAMKSMEDGLVNWQKFRKIYRVISDAIDRQNFSYVPLNTGANGSGNGTGSVLRKGHGVLRHDRKHQSHIRHRIETIRKDSSVLYQLARDANTQESILFVNSLSEAGFL